MSENPNIDILIPHALSDLEIQAFYVWLVMVSNSVIKRRPFERRNQVHADKVHEQRELLQLRLGLWQEESRNPLLQSELGQLETFLGRKVHALWEVAVTNGQQFEVNPITMSLRPFLVDIQAFEPMLWADDKSSSLELENLLGVMGAVPKTRIQIIGLQDKPEDHWLCAFMAADLLGQYQNAYAKIGLRPFFHTLRGAAEWTVDDSRQLAANLSGQAYEIAYGRRDNPKIYHLLDADSLRDWANHPRFFLARS